MRHENRCSALPATAGKARCVVPRRGVAVCVLLAVLVWGGASVWTPGSGPTAARRSRAQGAPLAPPELVLETGGSIGAVASDGAHEYIALGRRLLVYAAGATASDAALGEMPPVARTIVGIVPAGDHVLLRTGRPGMRGALVVVDVRQPRAPHVIGRLELLRSAQDLAWDGRWAWLARGAAGLARVDLSTPVAPRIVGQWEPDAPDGRRRGVVAVAARPGALAVLDAPPGTGFGQPQPDRLVILAPGEDRIVVRAARELAAPLRLWRLDARRAVVVDARQVQVLDWQAEAEPTLAAAVDRTEIALLDVVVVDDVLVTAIHARSEGGLEHVMLRGHDLRRGGRVIGEQATRLAARGWRGLAARKGGLLAADDLRLEGLVLRSTPRLVDVPRVATQRYVRVIAAGDGALAVTRDGQLDHVAADGTMSRLSARGVQVVDVAQTPNQVLAIVEGHGVVELRPDAAGEWRPGPTLLGAAEERWRALRVDEETVVAIGEDEILAARLPDDAVAAEVRIEARPVGGEVVLDGRELWLVDASREWLLGWRLWGDRAPAPLPGLSLRGAGARHPALLAGHSGRLLVADTTDLVYGIDSHGTRDATLSWRLDMPGQVRAMAAQADRAWVAWLADEPGLSLLSLGERVGVPRSAVFRGGWIHSLAAEGDAVWAVMEGGAMARYRSGRLAPGVVLTPLPPSPPTASGRRLWLPDLRVGRG